MVLYVYVSLFDGTCTWFQSTTDQEKYSSSGDDAVLLVKRLVNSESLSQRPLIAVPRDFLVRLVEPLQASSRNLISERARKELPVDC